jgi:hypothetical protein
VYRKYGNPLKRKWSASAPELGEQRQHKVSAERKQTATRSTSTQTVSSDFFFPPSETTTSVSTSISTHDTRISLGILPKAHSLFSLPPSSPAFASPPLAPGTLSNFQLSSSTSPSSNSSNVTTFDLDLSSTDSELQSKVQSAEVVDVVGSPVGFPTISRGGGSGRREVRSMARASLLPLGKTAGSSSASNGEGLAMMGRAEASTSQTSGEKTIDEVRLLKMRNRALEEEVSRLREALGLSSATSTESL